MSQTSSGTPGEESAQGPQESPNTQDLTQAQPQQSLEQEAGQGEQQPAAPTVTDKPAAKQRPTDKGPSVIVRYGLMRRLGQFRHNLETAPRPETKVVMRTDRGVELGEIVADVCDETCYGCVGSDRLAEYLQAGGPDYPFWRDGKVLRLANPQDVIDQRHLESSAKEEAAFCRQQIRELELKMRLVTVEHLLGGERILFYFSAESRVDFRELVRRLAGQYRTRIEMRQVGARDEARLVGDYERCGLRCCCQQFIKDLKPVSMRMAKMQKATLDPSKISGRCGRLMCCLRFEDAAYEELRQKLPRKNTWVKTDHLIGRVVEAQILTQLVRLELPDRSRVLVANEEIRQRDLPPPSVEPEAEPPTKPQVQPQERPLQQEEVSEEAAVQASPPASTISPGEEDQKAKELPAEQAGKPKSRRRRRRRPKAKAGQGAAQQQPAAAQGAGKGDSAQSRQASSRKRKPRRRRGKTTRGS